MICEVTESSQNHIDLIVKENTSVSWRLTCYYGFPKWKRRNQAWDFLRLLSTKSQLP